MVKYHIPLKWLTNFNFESVSKSLPKNDIKKVP